MKYESYANNILIIKYFKTEHTRLPLADLIYLIMVNERNSN